MSPTSEECLEVAGEGDSHTAKRPIYSNSILTCWRKAGENEALIPSALRENPPKLSAVAMGTLCRPTHSAVVLKHEPSSGKLSRHQDSLQAFLLERNTKVSSLVGRNRENYFPYLFSCEWPVFVLLLETIVLLSRGCGWSWIGAL